MPTFSDVKYSEAPWNRSCNFPKKFFTIVLHCTACKLLLHCCSLTVMLIFRKVYISLGNLLKCKVTNKIRTSIKCYKDANSNCIKEQLQKVRQKAALLCPRCALRVNQSNEMAYYHSVYAVNIFIACIYC